MTTLPALLFESASASVHFARACLEPAGAHLRSRSTFVDNRGRAMHWHDFGDLEGPGWAAHAVGGAHLLYRWGTLTGDITLQQEALALLDHVLEDGFIRSDGFIWPYWDLAQQRFCCNYTHNDIWLCPGSLAHIGVQLLDFAADLDSAPRVARMREAALALSGWLKTHVPLLDNSWVPRRITPEGKLYPLTPEGGNDPIFDHSADGLYLMLLWGLAGEKGLARRLGDAFIHAGGFWGSLNHDTYDDHENVAYAVAFHSLLRLSDRLQRPGWREFAYSDALPSMARFRMDRDRHGVSTRGLFWMEETWDTAYLWENAEVAHAHLHAWQENGDEALRDIALDTLSAMARHHDGPLGFLSEGIDWNNHVSQRHHAHFDYYGAIRYTEPLLNDLYLVGPTLIYLQAINWQPGADTDALHPVSPSVVVAPPAGVEGDRHPPTRLLLRLFHPAISTDEGVSAALDFIREAGIDGVLLFESSYDLDPALLTLPVLQQRFARLRELVPRFRAAGLEVHINVMITMGHVDGGGGRPEDFDFQFMVDEHGNTSRSTACPLDPAFLAYVAQIYRWAAECRADAVWVDDDVRFLWHDMPGMTCFCPHHLAAMSSRTGRTWTREELVTALADDHPAFELRNVWFALQEEAMSGLARCIETAVHTVDADQAIGLMTVGTPVHNAEGRRTDALLRTLNGNRTRPMLRPGSGFWHDWNPGEVLAKTEDVARQVTYLGRDVRTVAEIENHPYTPCQKSHRILALEMALNLLAGIQDLSLNWFSGAMPFDPGEYEYERFLQQQRPFLDALARACAGKVRQGIGVETREDVPRTMRLSGRGLQAWQEARPWELALSRLGLPLGRPYAAPHLFTGDTVYTDRYALGSAIQDGIVLTPRAAAGLLAQDWGDPLGLLAVHPAPLDVNELFTESALNGPHTGACLPVRHYYRDLQPYALTFAPSAQPEVLSRWVGLDGQDQGVAAAAFSLPDGRRVGYIPFELARLTPALLQPARRDQWAALFEWAGNAPLPVRIVDGVNLVPQLLMSRAGDEALLAVINLSADDAWAQLAAPALDHFTVVDRLNADGVWREERLPHRVPVAAWSLTALRWRN